MGGSSEPIFQTAPALTLTLVCQEPSRARHNHAHTEARAGHTRAHTSAALAPRAPDRVPSRSFLLPPPPRMPAAAPLCSAVAPAAGRPAPGSRLEEARQDAGPARG